MVTSGHQGLSEQSVTQNPTDSSSNWHLRRTEGERHEGSCRTRDAGHRRTRRSPAPGRVTNRSSPTARRRSFSKSLRERSNAGRARVSFRIFDCRSGAAGPESVFPETSCFAGCGNGRSEHDERQIQEPRACTSATAPRTSVTRMSTVPTFARARSNGRRRSPKASSRNARPKSRCAHHFPTARVRCRHLHRARRLLVAGARLQDAQPVRVPLPASPGVLRRASALATSHQTSVDAFLDHLATERKLSASSINHHRTIVNGIFNFAVKRGSVRQESGRSG